MHFIADALDQGDQARVLDHVKEMHAGDITELLQQITSDQREQLVSIIQPTLDPNILVDLDPEIKDEVISHLGTEDSAAAITQLEHDDALQVMEDLEQHSQEEILDAIDNQEHREALEQGLAYPEDAAARIMNPHYVAVPESWTVGKTIDYLRKEEDLPDDFYSMYVVDEDNKPVGYVLVSRAMRSKREVKLKDIMEAGLRTVNATTDQEDVAYMFQKYGFVSVPVVDDNGRIVGIVTLDDVVDVIREEAQEDIMHMGGVSGETDFYSAPIRTAIHRMPWLLVNLGTAIAASAVIALFEDSIERLVALAVLMPIVASMAGNAGMQTLTIAVRAIATKELTGTNAARVVRKEILAALANGIFFGVLTGIATMVIYQNTELSIIFAASMAVALIIAAFAGALIPLFMVRMGTDPAVTSVVFLTTVTDIAAFFIFLGLASMWLL